MSTMLAGHPHIKVYDGGSTFEHCEDHGCVVDPDGHASCGRVACPACGCGGANVAEAGDALLCNCGHAWRAAA
jgi:hypothetical protein